MTDYDRWQNLLLSDCQDELFHRENCASAHALLSLEMEDDDALAANVRSMLEAIPLLSGKQLAMQKAIPQAYAYHGNALGFAFLVERLAARQRKVDTRESALSFLQRIGETQTGDGGALLTPLQTPCSWPRAASSRQRTVRLRRGAARSGTVSASCSSVSWRCASRAPSPSCRPAASSSTSRSQHQQPRQHRQQHGPTRP